MTWMKMIPAMEGEECPAECPYPPNQNASQCLYRLYKTDLIINSNILATLIVRIYLAVITCHSSPSTENLSLNLHTTFFLCQTYSPTSQASQQESDSQGHL